MYTHIPPYINIYIHTYIDTHTYTNKHSHTCAHTHHCYQFHSSEAQLRTGHAPDLQQSPV